MRLVDWGVLEQHLLLKRKQSIILDDLPQEVVDGLKESIKIDRSVPLNELIDYASTPTGAIWRLWLSLREKYSYSQCAEWIANLDSDGKLGEYLAIAAQIDGIDIFASLDWPVLPFQKELELLHAKKNEGKTSVDWKVQISVLAEVYHLSPTAVGELTIYQARVLTWDREALQGRIKLTPDEHRNVVAMRKAHRFYAEKQAAQQNAESPLTE